MRAGSPAASRPLPRAGFWFYGWNVVGVTLGAQGLSAAVNSYAFGLFLVPVASEFGTSRTAVSFGLTLLLGAQALLSPAAGRWLDRGPIRSVMALGSLLLAGGLLACAAADALWQLGLALATAVALGCAILGPLSAAKLAANWFETRLGRALGVSAAGTSLGGLVVPPVLALGIESVGWRPTLTVFGLALAGLLLPLVWTVIRDRPADRGLAPDGADSPAVRASGAECVERPWTTARILRARAFWVLVGVLGLAMGSLSGTMTHLAPHALDRGLSTSAAALLISWLAAAGVVGKLGLGLLSDRIGCRAALASGIAAGIAGCLLLADAREVARFRMASAALGLATGGLLPSWSALVAREFGPGSVGRVMGLSFLAMQPLLLAGAPIAGLVRDRTGDYAGALLAFVSALAAALAAVALLPPAAAREAPGRA